MKLELLPNEILLECFEYFNPFEIFNSFYQLNSRINNLIHSIPLHINFQGIDKSIFDEFCSKLLLNPQLKNQINSIHLSNKYEYLQCNTFFSFFPFKELSHLQTFQTRLFNGSWSRRGITYPDSFLTVTQNDLISSNLQTLAIGYFDQTLLNTHQTSSIINLRIPKCYSEEFSYLIKHLPMLKYLHIHHIHHFYTIESNTQCAVHLKKLIIGIFDDDFQTLEMLIKQTPNLTSLAISSNSNDMVNANRWEDLIRSSVPFLKIFKFQFQFQYDPIEDITETMFNKLQQFQSDFWLKEHYWYTEIAREHQDLYIYTIPYLSTTYGLSSDTKRCSDNDNTFINIKRLELYSETMSNNCQYYFPNVTSLTLGPCYNAHINYQLEYNHLQKTVNLSRLRDLRISTPYIIEKCPTLLIQILKETSMLSSLTLENRNIKECYEISELCKYLHQRIKRLYIMRWGWYMYNFFEDDQFYKIFSNIEHLQCDISDENDLLCLLEHLPKLITLNLSWSSKNDFKTEFSRFEKYTQTRNILFDYRDKYNGDYEYDELYINYEIFIWIGQNTKN